MTDKTYIEYSDDIDMSGRTITIHISKYDMLRADLTKFDELLFDDIKNGKPSTTPLADQLLGLETLMRRIEEAK